MNPGDKVQVRHMGRVYFAEITEVTSRTAHVRFISQVPPIEGHRKRERAFLLSRFLEYGKAGVDYIIRGAA